MQSSTDKRDDESKAVPPRTGNARNALTSAQFLERVRRFTDKVEPSSHKDVLEFLFTFFYNSKKAADFDHHWRANVLDSFLLMMRMLDDMEKTPSVN